MEHVMVMVDVLTVSLIRLELTVAYKSAHLGCMVLHASRNVQETVQTTNAIERPEYVSMVAWKIATVPTARKYASVIQLAQLFAITPTETAFAQLDALEHIATNHVAMGAKDTHVPGMEPV